MISERMRVYGGVFLHFLGEMLHLCKGYQQIILSSIDWMILRFIIIILIIIMCG